MSGLRLEATAQSGTDMGRGSLLGVQPYMTPDDYASEAAFFAKLNGYLQAAAEQGWLGPRTIVVFPEYIGTWLVCAGERPAVYRSRTLTRAMLSLALNHPLAVAGAVLRAKEKDRLGASLFRVKAGEMARLYQAVFSRLAREHGVTIVAGSTILPEPSIQDGRLTAGRGPLYSLSAVFKPDGQLYPALVRKVVPIDTEKPFLSGGAAAELPVFETPAGRLGVLICADAWYPALYERLRAQSVELLAVPSYVSGAGLWDKPWGGYNGAAMPADVDPGDVGRLTEAQAWRKYALAGRLPQSSARAGVNAFLRGELWDLGADSGCTLAVGGDRVVVDVGGAEAALLNLWL